MSPDAAELIALAAQTKAKRLDLGACGITGALPASVCDLQDLEELILSDERWDAESNHYRSNANTGAPNRITHLPEGMARLTGLKCLIANDQPIDWGNAISSFPPNLEHLQIGGSGTRDILWIRHFPAIRHLEIPFCPITNLDGVECLSNLECLYAYNCEFSSLLPLQHCYQLENLTASGSPVASLDGLQNLFALLNLDLSFTQITELTEIQSIADMEDLSIAHTQVHDLAPIAHMRYLRRLNLEGTKVTDLRPLGQMQHLSYLSLKECPAFDLAPLAGLPLMEPRVGFGVYTGVIVD